MSFENAEADKFSQAFVEDFGRQPVYCTFHRSGPIDTRLNKIEHRERPLTSNDVLDHSLDLQLDQKFFALWCHQDAPKSTHWPKSARLHWPRAVVYTTYVGHN